MTEYIVKAVPSRVEKVRGYARIGSSGKLFFYEGPGCQSRASRFPSVWEARVAIAKTEWCAPPADVRIVRLSQKPVKRSLGQVAFEAFTAKTEYADFAAINERCWPLENHADWERAALAVVAAVRDGERS